MVKIETSYKSKPLEINTTVEKLTQFLLDVPTLAKCYPFVDTVETVSPGVYKWIMQERRVGSVQMKAQHIAKYTKSQNVVQWENLPGGNMSSFGKFTLTPGTKSVGLSAEANIETDIEIPKLLVGFARSMGNREMGQTWDAFLLSIKKTLETGTIVKVAPQEDVVKDEKFESVRNKESLRVENYNTMVSDYYDLVTETYQSGWGNHFHFAPFKNTTETLETAVKRLEHEVADAARITANSLVLDVGCGVGGPTLEIAKYTGCKIRGLNINKKQVGIATNRAKEMGLSDRAQFDHGDAMKMPYPDNTFDVVTFFESTCHMPDKAVFLKECFRVLKPGGRLSGSEWLQCVDPTEKEITQFIEPICAHHSCPHMGSLQSYRKMMEDAGLYVHIALDLRQCGDILRNWEILDNKTINTFKSLPKDGVDNQINMMISGAIALSEGARAGAFLIGRFLASKEIQRSKL